MVAANLAWRVELPCFGAEAGMGGDKFGREGRGVGRQVAARSMVSSSSHSVTSRSPHALSAAASTSALTSRARSAADSMSVVAARARRRLSASIQAAVAGAPVLTAVRVELLFGGEQEKEEREE